MVMPINQTRRWLLGTGVVLSAIVAYIVIRQQRKQLIPSSILTMSSRPRLLPKEAATDEDIQSLVTEVLGSEERETPIAGALAIALTELPHEATNTATQAKQQEQLIGNTRTKIYHTAHDIHLPIEENRIYFTSEREAIEAGYRKAE